MTRRKKPQPTCPYSEEHPLKLDAELSRQIKVVAAAKPGRRLVARIVRLMPSHRDSRRGRSNAAQLKGSLVVLGLAVAIFGGELQHMMGGALITTLALLLPVNISRKRLWLAKLGSSRRKVRREVQEAVQVVYNAKRVAVLDASGKTWRRVLLSQRNHQLQHCVDDRGAVWLGVLPPSDRKAESLWFLRLEGRAAQSDRDTPADAAGPSPELLDPERIDASVALESSQFHELRSTLMAWAKPRKRSGAKETQ